MNIAQNIYLNNTPVSRVYLGERIIFGGSQEPPTPTMSFKNVTHWVKGVNVPTPDKQHWGIAYAPTITDGVQMSSERIGLEWVAGQGWYDCTKLFPEGGQENNPENKDSNLCWAATASNMIHWWLDQNKDNIARYYIQNNIEDSAKCPSKYTDALHSDVWDYFKKCFTNSGLSAQAGLKWFFFNQFIYTSPGANTTIEGKKHKGFFKDVVDTENFQSTDLITTLYGDNFNEDLKEAFRKGMAIGLSIATFGGKGGHAITIWGAHFNENEIVDKLYICENNDRFIYDGENSLRPSPMEPGKLCRAGIYEHKVKINEDGKWALESGGFEKYTMTIDQVTYLNDGVKQWEAYFKSIGQ